VRNTVSHPKHYRSLGARCTECGASIECIQVAERFNFNRGNVLKYLWRAGRKRDELQDLLKARWYIDREIKRIRGKR